MNQIQFACNLSIRMLASLVLAGVCTGLDYDKVRELLKDDPLHLAVLLLNVWTITIPDYAAGLKNLQIRQAE